MQHHCYNNNGVPDIHNHQQHDHHHHHHHRHQELIENDECFSISNPLQNLTHPDYQLSSQQNKQQQQQQLLLQHQHQVQHQHSIPITHQLLQPHFRPAFQQQQQEVEGLLHSQIVATRQHQPFFLKFKLGLEQTSSSNKECALNHHNSTPHVPVIMQPPHHSWKDSTSSIREPFWKQLNTSNIKQQFENGEQEAVQGNNKNNKDLENKYSHFGGELEAIYNLAKVAETNQTGSGSALTSENSPKTANISMPFSAVPGQNAGVIGADNAGTGVDHGSENSIGEEASLRKSQKRMRKRKMKENLSSMARFFENLVKQVIDHQEMLHRKFLEVIDKMDKERTEREEAWRKQEAAKYNREAISRAHEQALASSREAQIVSCIEKITGHSIDLPARKTPLLCQQEISKELTKELTPTDTNINNRWPKAEVEALIQVRTNIETKFQEPGLKGPLWEEVSSIMSSMGYQRCAKRCKEKWENINKYFRKAKESTKKRSQQSKTCSYFNQLNQIYSRTLTDSPSVKTCSMPPLSSNDGVEKHQGYSDLLEAFISGRDITTSTSPSSKKMRIDEMGTSILEMDAAANEKGEQGSHDQEKDDHEDDYEMDTDEDQGSSSQDE
ncbi:trihelix transcription factor DF1 [Ricinus communis]|uniref:Myb-like domain-containing protein n=1 Tax=Ricinus communis TaxID=3988 RepID=B9RQW0_RICCO|nr:trihelix transcription factor DF1 [Ricinus communis]EEF46131.1 conserved hypothetical protein [Ricinus communis]|eukprot:XP_002516129.1 trihelix transcription factor GTL1 [Ricinus communis]